MKTRLKNLFRRIRIWPRCIARIMRIKYELFVLERNLRVLVVRRKYVHAHMTCLALEGMLVDIHAKRDHITIDPEAREMFDREIGFHTINDVVVCDQIKQVQTMINKRLFELGKLDEVVHVFAR